MQVFPEAVNRGDLGVMDVGTVPGGDGIAGEFGGGAESDDVLRRDLADKVDSRKGLKLRFCRGPG